ncbi:aminodeoxychorismate lyase [Corynebacterium timonense]|uniref:4-amino-4-deoxychorismate lyase n=1 Tax=Corynebacterium timonense TaxID=441500 RepID=A0A1H1LAK9_9CORY|nr:aminodeoxychorismate lyase [Corynebacterium timonense]SDR71568.1 4-amino-4-deoxychorismate lyase [Corynebacterium timonense]
MAQSSSFPHLAPQPVIYLVEPFGGSVRRQNANMPHIFWDDAVATRGDGIFETILVNNARPVNLERHLERFRRSAAQLDLPEPNPEQWRAATREAIADYVRERGGEDSAESAEASCVWTMSRGRATTGVPTAWLTVRPTDPEDARLRAEGVRVATAGRGYTVDSDASAPWLALGAKTLNYTATMAALRWAREHGYDDIIYIDPRTERVLEGTRSTVLVVKRGNRMRTPKAGPDVMAGTTIQAVFEYATSQGWRCASKNLYADDLRSAQSVWLVSSVRGPVRVTHLDGAALPEPDNASEIAQLIDASLAAQDT